MSAGMVWSVGVALALAAAACSDAQTSYWQRKAGRVRYDHAPPPEGGYLEPRRNHISINASSYCQRDILGYARCSHLPDYPPPRRRFRFFRLGNVGGCGVTLGGRLSCWVFDATVDLEAGAGWVTVSGTPQAGCAVHRSGQGWCWPSRATPFPDGNEFVDVSVRNWAACAVRRDDSTTCWPLVAAARGYPVQRAPGSYRQVDLTPGGGCGVTSSGQVKCWSDAGPSFPPTDVEHLEPAVRVEAALVLGFVCTLGPAGALRCMDLGDPIELNGADGQRFIDLAVSNEYICALAESGAEWCWVRKEDAAQPSGLVPDADHLVRLP